MTTSAVASDAEILLVDDGELDDVANVLEAEGLAFTRLRGGQIPADVAPPRDLLIVTPRRLDRVRRGSPPDAAPGRPHRIVAVEEDSPAMRRRLRRAGLHLLVRLPAAVQIWRLLISRALYQGQERREDLRVAVGSPVAIDADADHRSDTLLMDLSNRGCRLQTQADLNDGDAIQFSIPADHEATGVDEALTLSGHVRRIGFVHGSPWRTLAIAFDADMPEEDRIRLTALINRWAGGPNSRLPSDAEAAPTIPACTLPSLPDLTLDDETDPPVSARSEIRVRLSEGAHSAGAQADENRRTQQRGSYESPILAEGQKGPVVLIGRDLSASGMRIERIGALELGDRFRLALHGPSSDRVFMVQAEITRDDGEQGFVLLFDPVDAETATALEKLVACLPDVESLEDGEIGGLGAILSEIMVD